MAGSPRDLAIRSADDLIERFGYVPLGVAARLIDSLGAISTGDQQEVGLDADTLFGERFPFDPEADRKGT